MGPLDDATDTTADLGPCDGACADPTPVCDTATDTCVACLATADCETGVCDPATSACVQCLSTADCLTGVCDLASQTCVQCAANTHCTTTTASTCTDNTCRACVTSDDCSHLSGTLVCDAGTCVECTGTEFAACDNTVCDSRLNTCTALAPQSAGLCDACVSDAQCADGQLCVPQMFEKDDGTGLAEVGTFCLWERDATVPNAPNGACSTVAPFIDDVPVMSVDAVQSNVCGLRTTTCPALDQFSTNCPTAGMDEACGAPGFADGFCVYFDAAANKCTIQCGSDDDCRPGFVCDTDASPPICTL